MAEPVAIDKFTVPVSLLQGSKLWAAIDKGCSLCKVLFVEKENPADVPEDHIVLTCHSYLNNNFPGAIENLMQHMRVPADADLSQLTLKVTGAGCEKEMELLREKTPFKVTFVDEFYSQGAGHYWFLKNLDLEEICYPQSEIRSPEMNEEKRGFLQRIGEAMRKELDMPEQTTTFPCIVAFLGSAAGFIKLEEDGKVRMCGGAIMGGKTFLALGRLLVGTSNYNEIIELAEKGNRCNTDTQIKDVFSNREHSPYGEFDPEMPIFPFGKAADQNKDLKDFRREDVAASLAHAVAANLIFMIMSAARTHKVRKIFIGGNLCRSLYFRRLMLEQPSPYTGIFDIRCLRTGHTAAVGAMLASDEANHRVF